MSKYDRNIYSSVRMLEDALSKKYLECVQRNFVNYILYGSLSWVGLMKYLQDLSLPQDLSHLYNVIAVIEKEISNNKGRYKRLLKTVSKDIEAVIFRYLQIQYNIPTYQQSLILLNDIYSQTLNHFHGKIILTINQQFDYRLGNSKGGCFGYAAEWLRAFLYKAKPFGVNDPQSTSFKPTNYDPIVMSQQPDINHKVFYTDKIDRLQKLYRKRTALNQEMSKNQNNALSCITIQKSKFFIHKQSVIDTVLARMSAQQQHRSALGLKLGKLRHAHYVAIGRDEQGYFHFVDANVGWCSFENQFEFKAWFQFYLDTIPNYATFRTYKLHNFEFNVPTDKIPMINRMVNTKCFNFFSPLKACVDNKIIGIIKHLF